MVIAIGVSAIGASWDISWHMTIGRDSFWTPAHIAIYLGGATVGFGCGWLAFRTTFLASEVEKRAGVGVWGARAPFGAWVSIWGAMAMLTSGPFDDWWHNAYGLDVKIISPPHVVLFLGGVGVRLGVWLLVFHQYVRTGTRAAAILVCVVAGMLLQEVLVIFTAEFWPNRQHSSAYFFVAAAALPFLLAVTTRISPLRWAATIAGAGSMCFVLLFVWILPLFKGRPGLGPIYHPVTHMVPPPFPQWTLLLALAMDLLKGKGARPGWRGDLAFALVTALAFLVVFLPVQWLFARFYLSPAADNWFFAGSRHWAYTSSPVGDPVLTTFWGEDGWEFWSVVKAFGAATLSTFLGRRFGGWMREVKR